MIVIKFVVAIFTHIYIYVGSMVEWLEPHCDQYGLSLKPVCTILFHPYKSHFMALSLACWSWQAVLNFNHICIKF